MANFIDYVLSEFGPVFAEIFFNFTTCQRNLKMYFFILYLDIISAF